MSTVPLRAQPIYLTAAANKGASWKQVLRTVPADRFTNAEMVRVTKLKVTRRAGVVVKITSESRSKGDVYVTEFEYMNPDDTDRRKMSCNCSDFVYRWEYALYRKGGADIRYSDGSPSNKTNPTLTLGVCKHLIALDQMIQERRLI